MSDITLPEVSVSTAPAAASGLLDEIMAQTRFKPESESYDSHAPLELRFHIVAYLHFSDRQDVLEFDVMLENRQHWCVE